MDVHPGITGPKFQARTCINLYFSCISSIRLWYYIFFSNTDPNNMVSLVLRHPHLYGTPLSHTLPTPGGPMMSTEMIPKVITVKNIIKQQALKCQDQARKNTYGPSHPGPSPIPLNENVMLIAFEKSSPTPSWLGLHFEVQLMPTTVGTCYLRQLVVLPSDQKGGDCSKNASQEHAKAPQVSANSL